MKNIPSKLFLLVLAALFIADSIKPVRVFSDFEKRALAQFPRFDLSSLIDNDYTKDLESFINDQFFGRDFWVSLKSSIETGLGKSENNGILLGSDHYLFEKKFTLSQQAILNIGYLKEFKELYADFPLTILLAPNSDAIYSEKLPVGTPQFDQISQIKQWEDNLGLLNVSDKLLTHKDSSLYYLSDHHWTLDGAYLAYQAVIESWGLIPMDLDSFDVKEVEGFLGTYHNKARPKDYPSETLDYVDPPILSYLAGDEIHDSLIDKEALGSSDKYGAFLHGNHGYAQIIVRESLIPNRILVIKDSYANSLIPFLTSHFDVIDVVDLRHFNGSLKTLITGSDYKQILYLQNFNQFSLDVNVAKLRY